MTTPLLTAHQISAAFDGRSVLHGIHLQLMPGEIVSLIGPNGAGKTTLLRVLLGLQRSESGSVTRAPQLRIGYVPQRLPLDSLLPMTAGRFLALWGQDDTAIDKAGARPLLGRPLQKLSGGELQCVLLARALSNQPQLLVLDEPAQALDLAGQRALYDTIGRVRDETGCGVLLVSHDLNIVMRKTDRVICLHGHICCQGKPDDVSRDPAYTALFGPAADAFAVYHHHHDHDHTHD